MKSAEIVKKLTAKIADLEELATEKAKAEGRYEEALSALKKAGYDSVEDAVEARKQMVEDKEKAKANALEILEKIEVDYADHIE